jgi:hypothetical protein
MDFRRGGRIVEPLGKHEGFLAMYPRPEQSKTQLLRLAVAFQIQIVRSVLRVFECCSRFADLPGLEGSLI